jgi:hypothetical protein
MKNALLAISALLLFALVACSNQAATDQTIGGLSIPVTEHDFGDIIRGDKVQTTFKIENVGSKTVKILDTKASCGCTVAIVSNAALEPGQTSEITVTFDSRGRQGDQKKDVRVSTDDPAQPLVNFEILGNVVVDLDFDRPVVRFQPIRRGETQLRNMPIIIRKPDGVTLGEPVTDLADLSVRVITETDEKGIAHPSLELSYTPTEVGFKRGTVRLSTGDPRRPEISLTVSAKVDGEISIIPGRVNMWRGQPDVAPSVVRLVANDVAFNIVSITDPKGMVDTQRTPFKDEKGWEIRVLLAQGKRDFDKSFNTELIVTTDHAKMKTIAIPISYSANEKQLRPARSKSDRPKPANAPTRLQVEPQNQAE